MKFLLTALNTKYIHSNPAVYSLRAYVKSRDEVLASQVEIAEYTINNQLGDIVADIYKRKPDVIAFSCYIWNITEVMHITEDLHKIMPDLPIWLGGPEVSFDAPKLLESKPQLTGIMIGEGEETFYELLSSYEEVHKTSKSEQVSAKENVCEYEKKVSADEGKASIESYNQKLKSALRGIKGLALKSGLTGERQLTNLNDLPFLYEEMESFQNKIIYYEASRGCPFRCSYCLSSIDKKVRFRDLDTVKKELKFFLDNKVSQVKFVDRTFNCKHEHAMEIWQYIYEHDNGITNFHFEISADLLNEEELLLLSKLRKGAVQLEIGVQSTNEKTITAINRTMNLERLKQTVHRLKQGENIHLHLDLIAGLPYEDYETFKKSFNEVYAMEPQQLQLGFLKVLKGSMMHECAAKYGINYMSRPPYEVLYSKWISYEEICRLKQIEQMVEIYYNSNQFTTTIPLLMGSFESAFDFYESLSAFYEKNGYFVSTPSRIYRYVVLLAFANECTNLEADLIKEALTMDVYLRENSKSRPEFAKDLSVYKETFRAFYQMEARERAVLPDYLQYDARQLAKMTHMEAFTYDLKAKTKRVKPQIMLFDYKNRSRLTYEATVIDVTNRCINTEHI